MHSKYDHVYMYIYINMYIHISTHLYTYATCIHNYPNLSSNYSFREALRSFNTALPTSHSGPLIVGNNHEHHFKSHPTVISEETPANSDNNLVCVLCVCAVIFLKTNQLLLEANDSTPMKYQQNIQTSDRHPTGRPQLHSLHQNTLQHCGAPWQMFLTTELGRWVVESPTKWLNNDLDFNHQQGDVSTKSTIL